jgi:hypothetical protein
LRALPALKAGTLEAGILIFSPVWGFLPSLALRSRTENFPKPVIRTSSPPLSASESAFLSRLRYRIDTVFSQLVGHYSVKPVWARELWHLTSQLLRKVLIHTVAFLLNHRAGNQPLQLAKLLH